jgi:predicted GH43/DUF377 family glycosyl hydrolase
VQGAASKWEKRGRLLHADGTIPWMYGFTGAAAFDDPHGEGPVDLYISGRDDRGRSMIGRARIDLDRYEVLELEEEPVFTPGQLGAFDENGVSYPTLVRTKGELLMYYTGWVPTVLTPFQNHLGLARLGPDRRFHRVSRAPILHRNDDDFLSVGSSYVSLSGGVWRLWYTSFLEWGSGEAAPKHRYEVKLALSLDGQRWERPFGKHICVGAENPGEHSFCRPSVLFWRGLHHMWYAFRGEHYRIGYATSEDGVHWERKDDLVGLELSADGWDSKEQCYPHVIRRGNVLHMVYSGNGYGRDGLGLARMEL